MALLCLCSLLFRFSMTFCCTTVTAVFHHVSLLFIFHCCCCCCYYFFCSFFLISRRFFPIFSCFISVHCCNCEKCHVWITFTLFYMIQMQSVLVRIWRTNSLQYFSNTTINRIYSNTCTSKIMCVCLPEFSCTHSFDGIDEAEDKRYISIEINCRSAWK